MEITGKVISEEVSGKMAGNVQGIRSIHGRYKKHRGRLIIVWEMEKPKNFYVQPMDMNKEGDCCMEGEVQGGGE